MSAQTQVQKQVQEEQEACVRRVMDGLLAAPFWTRVRWAWGIVWAPVMRELRRPR